MPQKLLKSKPTYVDTDTADIRIGPGASRYLKNYRNNFNKNPSGTEGGNFGVATPLQSTLQTVVVNLPVGTNRKCGGDEFVETNEYIYCNWNSNGFHGIYKINGKDLTCDLIIVDPLLNFSQDPRYYISGDRIALKVIYITDEFGNKTIFEKFLLFTDKNNWQRWINIQAAIATAGFNEINFPYFKTQYPFYDRNELIEYAPRPPLLPPVLTEIPFTLSDSGKTNHLLKTATQLAYNYQNTDGRPTALSAYSEPYYQIESACNINNQGIPRGLSAKLYAGGPLVEKINIYVKNCNSDFVLYDTIFKYDTCGANDPDIIGTSYWKRTNPFSGLNYDPETNTIEYQYYGDKESIPFDNSPLGDTYFQTSLPIKSNALADAGDAIMMGNNLKFYNNFDCKTIDNIKLSVTEADQTNICQPKTVKISCYAYIGEQGHANQVVWCANATTDTKRRFGGIAYNTFPANPLNLNVGFTDKYNLYLGDKDGFIGYLAGTPYFAVGQQYIVDSNGNLTYVGVINDNNITQVASITETLIAGGYFIQKFDFVVPAGNYIFRLGGHNTAISGQYQLSSTYAYYTCRHEQILFLWNNNILPNNNTKEFEIKACDGDIDLWTGTTDDLLIIYTPPPIGFYKNSSVTLLPAQNYDEAALSAVVKAIVHFASSDEAERFIDGYFTESETSVIGWEGSQYGCIYGQIQETGGYTDHNGFFFAYCARNGADSNNVYFSFYANCSYIARRIRTQLVNNGQSGYFTSNLNWADNNGGIIGAQNRLVINGKISNCANIASGISGVGVTVTMASTFYSDGEGSFEIILHQTNQGSSNNTQSRTGRIYYNAGGACLFVNCDCSCVPTDVFDFGFLSCYQDQAIIYPIPLNRTFKLVIANLKGLKGGGRYPVSIVGFDAAERACYANLIQYIDIPTFLESGVYTPSILSWKLLGNLNLPDWIRSVSFFVGKNTNFKSYLQWVGDKIEFIDTNGNIVADGENAIRARVTIQSLLDFNLANNFATTATYQFVPGDIIRFYDDGSGNLFKPDPITGFMDYQILGSNFNESVEGQIATQVTSGSTVTTTTITTSVTQSDGKSFIINFDSRLLALINSNNISACGFWIELIRPISEASVELMGEIAQKYPVINGEIANNITSGIINAFDTYYQNRNIIIQLCGGKTFLHPFESSSITDYWGQDCIGFGRVTVQDTGVKQYWDETEITKSDEFINDGRVVGIGTFRGKSSKFPGQKRGGVVAIHVETKIILFICENDVFLTDYNEAFVQTQGNSGYVTATLDNIIGDPSKKAGITHGCSEEDRSTIIFEKGLAFWLDRKNSCPIVFDYEQGPYKSVKPEDISEENKSWFINKVNYLVNFNTKNDLSNLMETSAGYDPKNNDYILTFRPRSNLNNQSQFFVNNERETKIPLQETFVYNLDQKKWVNFTGYTPEGYGTLRGAISGMELLSFVNGKPYFHNSENNANFNTFYGIETETVFELSISGIEEKLEDKAKVYQSLFLQLSGDPFFVDKIITNNPKLFSYIPLAYWKKRFNIWFSTILGDGNTYPDPNHPVPSQLIDGNKVIGFWARIRFVKAPNTLSNYFELEKIATRVCGSEKTDK